MNQSLDLGAKKNLLKTWCEGPLSGPIMSVKLDLLDLGTCFEKIKSRDLLTGECSTPVI